jgi:tetratricopeptide (TPR) repeat protein
MGRAALKPSPAVGRYLRQRRRELRLTLKEVSAEMGRFGETFPVSTLVRIEQGKLDPGLRRFHLLLKLYNIPAHLMMDLMDLEELAVEEPTGKDLETLFRDGLALWKRGEIGEALAHLFAIRRQIPDSERSRTLRQEATLSFAIAARDLGKLRLARQLVDDLLCEAVDEALLGQLLILASTLWSRLGSATMGLVLIRGAMEHLEPSNHRQQAWVLHQQARLLIATGAPEDAERLLDEATKKYRKLGDTHGETQVSIVRIGALEARDEIDGAISCARRTIRFAAKNGHDLSALSARLELGRLLVRSGASDKGLEELRKALSQAVLLEDRIAEFYAHYHLWKTYELLGQSEPARFEFQVAVSCVRFIDEPTPEANEIRRIAQERELERKERRGPA